MQRFIFPPPNCISQIVNPGGRSKEATDSWDSGSESTSGSCCTKSSVGKDHYFIRGPCFAIVEVECACLQKCDLFPTWIWNFLLTGERQKLIKCDILLQPQNLSLNVSNLHHSPHFWDVLSPPQISTMKLPRKQLTLPSYPHNPIPASIPPAVCNTRTGCGSACLAGCATASRRWMGEENTSSSPKTSNDMRWDYVHWWHDKCILYTFKIKIQ